MIMAYIDFDNSTLPNIGAGVFYYTDKFYAGLSLPNIIESKHFEKNNGLLTQASEKMHYFLTTGYVFDVSETLKFKPSIMAKAVPGSPLSLDVSANFLLNDKLELGLSHRLDDSVSGLIGFAVAKGLRIGYAYDYTLSNLGDYNSGSHEAFFIMGYRFIKRQGNFTTIFLKTVNKTKSKHMNFSKKNHESRQVNIKEMSKIYIIIAMLFSVSLISAQTTAGKYTIKNINVNTKSADFGTAYFGTDSVVFSSPRSKRSLIRNIWKPNEQPYLDLYVGKIGDGGEIEGKRKVKGAVNTRFHEAIVAFTNNMKTVYYTGNNNYQNVVRNDTTGTLRLQLYKAAVTADGAWANIEKLPFNNDEFSTGHPALNADGTKLYFVSDRPGTLGQTDIYRVDINTDGSYSEPENLGSNINSPGKEMFPYLVDDIIYYSSDGHHGAGGLDVFANRMFDSTISRPLNLGEPINSAQDDFALILKEGKGLFFFK